MAGYTVEIGEGSDLKTLNANVRFSHRWEAVPSDAGVPNVVRYFLDAEGSVVKSSATAVFDEILDLADEVRTTVRPRKLVVKLDGTAKYTIEPADAVGSPIITSFEAGPDDDGGESHMRWKMQAFALLLKRDASPADVYDLTTSLEITKVNGEIVRKVWRAAAKAKTMAKAKAAILTYKPAETKIREVIQTFAQEARATGVWIWDAKDPQGNSSFRETVEVTPGNLDYTIESQIGEADGDPLPPVLHEKAPSVWIVRITGRVSRQLEDDEDALAVEPPPAHYSEGETTRRVRAKERFPIEVLTAVPDADATTNRLFHLDYDEVWYFTSVEPPPLPDHGDHATLLGLPAPSDGQINEA